MCAICLPDPSSLFSHIMGQNIRGRGGGGGASSPKPYRFCHLCTCIKNCLLLISHFPTKQPHSGIELDNIVCQNDDNYADISNIILLCPHTLIILVHPSQVHACIIIMSVQLVHGNCLITTPSLFFPCDC